MKLKDILDEIVVNKPNKRYFTINTEEDRNKFIDLASQKGWIFFTGDNVDEHSIALGKNYKVVPWKRLFRNQSVILVYPENEKEYLNEITVNPPGDLILGKQYDVIMEPNFPDYKAKNATYQGKSISNIDGKKQEVATFKAKKGGWFHIPWDKRFEYAKLSKKQLKEIIVNKPGIKLPLVIHDKKEYDRYAFILDRMGYRWIESGKIINWNPYIKYSYLKSIVLYDPQDTKNIMWLPLESYNDVFKTNLKEITINKPNTPIEGQYYDIKPGKDWVLKLKYKKINGENWFIKGESKYMFSDEALKKYWKTDIRPHESNLDEIIINKPSSKTNIIHTRIEKYIHPLIVKDIIELSKSNFILSSLINYLSINDKSSDYFREQMTKEEYEVDNAGNIEFLNNRNVGLIREEDIEEYIKEDKELCKDIMKYFMEYYLKNIFDYNKLKSEIFKSMYEDDGDLYSDINENEAIILYKNYYAYKFYSEILEEYSVEEYIYGKDEEITNYIVKKLEENDNKHMG